MFCNTKMKWHILIRATNWAFHKSFFSTNAREVWQFEDKKDEQWFSAWLKTWSFLLHSCTLSEKSIFCFPNDYDDIIIIISQWVVGDKILPLSCNWIFSTFQIFPLDHMTWNNFCDDNDDDFFSTIFNCIKFRLVYALSLICNNKLQWSELITIVLHKVFN